MAARAGIEPTTLRLKAIDSTKVPPCPTFVECISTFNKFERKNLEIPGLSVIIKGSLPS